MVYSSFKYNLRIYKILRYWKEKYIVISCSILGCRFITNYRNIGKENSAAIFFTSALDIIRWYEVPVNRRFVLRWCLCSQIATFSGSPTHLRAFFRLYETVAKWILTKGGNQIISYTLFTVCIRRISYITEKPVVLVGNFSSLCRKLFTTKS